MSRLLNPGIGEITDRLTILALKIRYGLDAGRDVSHFGRERAGLLTKIRSATLNGSWFEQTLALGAVNAALWHRTDEQRRYVNAASAFNWEDAGRCGIAIMKLNDERASLVEAINVQTGESYEEKQ